LRFELLIRGLQLRLQILRADVAEDARRRLRCAPQGERGRDRRGDAYQDARGIGEKAGRLRDDGPLAGLQAEHGQAFALVARRGEIAWNRVWVFERERRAFDRLPGLVLDDADDAAALREGGTGGGGEKQCGDASEQGFHRASISKRSDVVSAFRRT